VRKKLRKAQISKVRAAACFGLLLCAPQPLPLHSARRCVRRCRTTN